MQHIRYSVEAYDSNGDMRDCDFAQTKREAVTIARRMRAVQSVARISIYPSKDYVVNYDHEVWGWKIEPSADPERPCGECGHAYNAHDGDGCISCGREGQGSAAAHRFTEDM